MIEGGAQRRDCNGGKAKMGNNARFRDVLPVQRSVLTAHKGDVPYPVMNTVCAGDLEKYYRGLGRFQKVHLDS
jgi:hypothetical protein